MSQFDKIVQVNISRETAGVEEKSFGVALVLGKTKAFTDTASGRWRVREYSNIGAVLTDFAETTPEYKGAQAYFSQNPQPTLLMIGQAWGTETVTASIAACVEANSGWYGLILVSRLETDVIDAATAIEAGGERVFVTATANPSTIDAEATSTLVSGLSAFDRTLLVYHSTAATAYPDAAAFGAISTMQPGEYTMNLQRLQGVVADKLTDTQQGTAETRKVTIYKTTGGLDRTIGGAMAGGEWFDIMVFVDWMKARLQERTFGVLARGKKKIPYTNAGIAILENQTISVLKDGVKVGGLSPMAYDSEGEQVGGYIVKTKDISELPFNDKASRKVDAISFTGWLAGAVHTTIIRGTVTY